MVQALDGGDGSMPQRGLSGGRWVIVGRAALEAPFKDTPEGRAFYPRLHRGEGVLVTPAQEAAIKARLLVQFRLCLVWMFAPSVLAILFWIEVLPALLLGLPAAAFGAWRTEAAMRRLAEGLPRAGQRMTRAEMREARARHTSAARIIAGFGFVLLMLALGALGFWIAARIDHLPIMVLCGFVVLSMVVLLWRQVGLARLKGRIPAAAAGG